MIFLENRLVFQIFRHLAQKTSCPFTHNGCLLCQIKRASSCFDAVQKRGLKHEWLRIGKTKTERSRYLMPEKMRKVPQLSFYFVISLLRSGILISEKQHYDVSDEITGNFLLCATTSIGTKTLSKYQISGHPYVGKGISNITNMGLVLSR